MNQSSPKKRRMFEDCDNTSKRLHMQDKYYGEAQEPEPTVGNSGSASLVSQSSSRHSSVLELSLKTIDNLCKEPSSGQSPCYYVKKKLSMGANQTATTSPQNCTVKLMEIRSPSKSAKECLAKTSEENIKRDKSISLLSTEATKKEMGRSPHFHSRSHSLSQIDCNTSVVNNLRRKSHRNTDRPVSKTKSGSQSFSTAKQDKIARQRRFIPIPDDIDELFTPDPVTFLINPAPQTAKSKINEMKKKSSTSGKSCSLKTVSSSSTTVTGASCCKKSRVSLPIVALEQIKLESERANCPNASKLKTSPELTLSGKLDKGESVTPLPSKMKPCTEEMDTTASVQTSTSPCSPSALLESKASEWDRKQVTEDDPIDVELDLGLSLAVDLDLTHSSQSSEEEELLSLQEMMARAAKPPDTPEKGTFSEPSTPGCHRGKSKAVSPTWLVYVLNVL